MRATATEQSAWPRWRFRSPQAARRREPPSPCRRRESANASRRSPARRSSPETSSHPGQRATYEKLLAAGVRIFEFQPSMMHSKTMAIDGRIAVVGSTNMDQLSFERLEEGSIVAESPALAAHLERTLRADFGRSKEITREGWARRDPITDAVRDAASFFSEWM